MRDMWSCRSIIAWPRRRSCRRSLTTCVTPLPGFARRAPKSFGARADRIAVLGGSAGGYLDPGQRFLDRAAPGGAGVVLGLRRHRRPLVQPARPVLPPPAARVRGRGPLCGGNEEDRGAAARKPAGRDSISIAGRTASGPRKSPATTPTPSPRPSTAFCPVRNLSPSIRRRCLIHGTNDTDVPHEQSVVMDRELARHRVAS